MIISLLALIIIWTCVDTILSILSNYGWKVAAAVSACTESISPTVTSCGAITAYECTFRNACSWIVVHFIVWKTCTQTGDYHANSVIGKAGTISILHTAKLLAIYATSFRDKSKGTVTFVFVTTGSFNATRWLVEAGTTNWSDCGDSCALDVANYQGKGEQMD